MSLAHRRTVAALPLTDADCGLSDQPRGPSAGSSAAGGSGTSHRGATSSRSASPTKASALPAAFKDALAVYYYPGTWDWQHELKQSLVHKALRRSLEATGALDELASGTTGIDAYDGWAVTVDDFAPVKIEHDVAALVHDPADPERGLLTPDGSGVTYTCRVDLLAVDAADEYWVVRHQIVDEWQPVQELVRDEEAIAACWAWQQDYIGMEIAGTIHNEVRLRRPARRSRRRPERDEQGRTGGPARTERRRPLNPAARAACGPWIQARRQQPRRAAHRGDRASHPHSTQPRRNRGHRKPFGGRSPRDGRCARHLSESGSTLPCV